METSLLKYLNDLNQGDKISLVLNGMIVNGTLEEVANDCVVLSEATSDPNKKKQYPLSIPLENIYAWGRKEKKKK